MVLNRAEEMLLLCAVEGLVDWLVCAFWGVRKYFQYNPSGDCLDPRLQVLLCVQRNYQDDRFYKPTTPFKKWGAGIRIAIGGWKATLF